MATSKPLLLLVLMSASAGVLAGPSALIAIPSSNISGPSGLRARPVAFMDIRAMNAFARTATTEAPCEGVDDGASKCKNCQNAFFCFGGNPIDIECPEGNVCLEDKCQPTAAPSTRSKEKCVCEEGDDSFVADQHDESSYLVCPSGELATCPEGEVFDEDEQKCVAGSGGGGDFECTEMGTFPVLPDCKAYYTCYKDGDQLLSTGPEECQTDNPVFSVDAGACTSLPDTTPTPATCSEFGLLADGFECNRYHLCAGPGDPAKSICCEDGQVFENTKCVDSSATTAPVVCYDECMLNSLGGVTPVCASSPALTTSSGTGSTPTGDSTSTEPSTDTTSSDSSASSETPTSSKTSASSDTPASSLETTPSSSDTSPSTTSATPTCTAEGTIPYPGDCSKYYVCREVSGSFEIKEFTCPGNLVYSPSKQYCTLLANVPECQ